MDNNNMPMPPEEKIQPVIPQVPHVTPNPQPEKESNKMILWLVLGLVLIIVAVGGIYWYLSNKQKPLTNIETATQAGTQTANSTPVPENLDTLGTQADSANVPDGAEDFSALDKDLQNL